jgi:hypothetical protein
MNSTTVRIRPFFREDAPAIVRIMATSFKEKFRHLTSLPEEHIEALLSDMNIVHTVALSGHFVAEDATGVVGVLALRWAG